MRYMINVDLERTNVYGGKTNCDSVDHRSIGEHFDLTVHDFDKGCRGLQAAHNPPTRWWDDNGGVGYTTEELSLRLRALERSNAETYSRACGKCKVPSDVLK